jgi:hypothetical protein
MAMTMPGTAQARAQKLDQALVGDAAEVCKCAKPVVAARPATSEVADFFEFDPAGGASDAVLEGVHPLFPFDDATAFGAVSRRC